MKNEIKINNQGYVEFDSKNWSYQGDKGSWAKVVENKVSVKRAAKGIISSAYSDELEAFCAEYGIDWNSISCGQVVSVEISDEPEQDESVVEIDGQEINFEAAVNLMDEEIREQLHSKMAPCKPQDFVNAYLSAHAIKFKGQEFTVN